MTTPLPADEDTLLKLKQRSSGFNFTVSGTVQKNKKTNVIANFYIRILTFFLATASLTSRNSDLYSESKVYISQF